jgi:hypothetical protein
MVFEIVGKTTRIETIAVGGKIRDIMRIQRQFGLGKWRKLKGIADIRLPGCQVRKAEIYWYEAHGKGGKKFKSKRFVGR